MPDLMRSRSTTVWAALVAMTLVSWGVGTDLGALDSPRLAAVVIFAVACIKIRLVGLHFMELTEAPVGLRGAFEAYVGVLFVVLSTLYLLA